MQWDLFDELLSSLLPISGWPSQMHDGDNLDEIGSLRMPLYAVQRIFEIVEEALRETGLFFAVEGGGCIGFCPGFSVPAQLHRVYFPRSSLIIMALSSNLVLPLSISALRRWSWLLALAANVVVSWAHVGTLVVFIELRSGISD